jgi:N-acylneuraminate cytidylyltransferase|tara:strand:+ start:12905 stop:13597 length:693 start_codon:yes stop_codon:yes gene_type:complete
MNIAIIPARAESKRIKKKNIKIFHGKPIIVWSIQEALKSKLFSKVIVSTDSKKIANLSKKYGAEVPYLRSKSLSNSTANINDVIFDVLKYYKDKKIFFNYASLIYATAPFLKSQDLKKGFNILKKNKKLDYVLSISKFKSAYYRSLKIRGNKIKPVFKKYIFSRSQLIKDFYFDNAQFTIGRSKSWLKKKHSYISNTSYVYIPSHRSQDIDTIEDWKRSEILFKLLKKKK